jgi:fatty acid-binding protein DegV
MAFRTLGNLTQQYYHDHIKKGNAFSTSQTHGQKNLSV